MDKDYQTPGELKAHLKHILGCTGLHRYPKGVEDTASSSGQTRAMGLVYTQTFLK